MAEIHSGKTKISDIVKEYGVADSGVRKWLKKYSLSHKPAIKIVVELEPEAQKTAQLAKRVAELERIVGGKQLEIDFLNTLVKVSSEELGTDFRKVFLPNTRPTRRLERPPHEQLLGAFEGEPSGARQSRKTK